MSRFTGTNTNWIEGEAWSVTAQPSTGAEAPMAGESESALTAAAVAGVALVVLVAIAAVFLLGVFIDCRHQKLVEKKMGVAKRQKNRRINNDPESDGAGIAENMQESAQDNPPALTITIDAVP